MEYISCIENGIDLDIQGMQLSLQLVIAVCVAEGYVAFGKQEQTSCSAHQASELHMRGGAMQVTGSTGWTGQWKATTLEWVCQ